MPGEAVTITITASVNNNSAAELNLGPKTLEYNLVLHTVLGKDHFVAVSGEYGTYSPPAFIPAPKNQGRVGVLTNTIFDGTAEYTCFANSLSRLTRIPGPIRSLASPDDILPEDHARNAPKEVMRLINWLMGPDVDLVGVPIL